MFPGHFIWLAIGSGTQIDATEIRKGAQDIDSLIHLTFFDFSAPFYANIGVPVMLPSSHFLYSSPLCDLWTKLKDESSEEYLMVSFGFGVTFS